MNELVQRLSEGEHPVEASLRPEKTATALKESIDLGYVHIKFTNTKGGTDLSVKLDPEASNFTEADFEHQKGKVHLVGDLTLNYVKVRCIAGIDLATLNGKGHLEPVEA
jgi:Core binding factor beta subunit